MNILVIPIGPPGSGKTYFRYQLKDYCLKKNLKYIDTNRDELFSEIRKKNSLKKTRRILYDLLMDFYEDINKNSYDIIYIDSTNSNKDIREKFIDSISPKQTIFINFIFLNSISDNIQFLLNRTINRKHHPTFPKFDFEQEKIIKNIIPKIEYQYIEDDKKKIINHNIRENNLLEKLVLEIVF